MENKNARAGGQPGTGKSGVSNRPYNTTLWFRLHAIEGHLLLIFIEQVGREVAR